MAKELKTTDTMAGHYHQMENSHNGELIFYLLAMHTESWPITTESAY